jgi:hypothetical protein
MIQKRAVIDRAYRKAGWVKYIDALVTRGFFGRTVIAIA